MFKNLLVKKTTKYLKIHVNNIKKGTSVLQQQKIRVIINGVIMISFFGSTGLYTTENRSIHLIACYTHLATSCLNFRLSKSSG